MPEEPMYKFVVWRYAKGHQLTITMTKRYNKVPRHMTTLGIYDSYQEAQVAHPKAEFISPAEIW